MVTVLGVTLGLTEVMLACAGILCVLLCVAGCIYRACRNPPPTKMEGFGSASSPESVVTPSKEETGSSTASNNGQEPDCGKGDSGDIDLHADNEVPPTEDLVSPTKLTAAVGLGGGEAIPGHPGWERKYDHMLAKHFYVDHNTQTTHWQHPDATVRERAMAARQLASRQYRRERRRSQDLTGASVNTSALLNTPRGGSRDLEGSDQDQTTCKTPDSTSIHERQRSLDMQTTGGTMALLQELDSPDYIPDAQISPGVPSDTEASVEVWDSLVPLVPLHTGGRLASVELELPSLDSTEGWSKGLGQWDTPSLTRQSLDLTETLADASAAEAAWQTSLGDEEVGGWEDKVALLSEPTTTGLAGSSTDGVLSAVCDLSMRVDIEERVGARFDGACEVAVPAGRVYVTIQQMATQTTAQIARFVLVWVPLKGTDEDPQWSVDLQQVVGPRFNPTYMSIRESSPITGDPTYTVAIPKAMWGTRLHLLDYKVDALARHSDAAPLLLTAYSEVTATHQPDGFEVFVRVRCEANVRRVRGGTSWCGTFRKLKILVPSGRMEPTDFRHVTAEPEFAKTVTGDSSYFVWHLDELEPGLPQELTAHLYTKTEPLHVREVFASFLCTGDVVSGVRLYCAQDETCAAHHFPGMAGPGGKDAPHMVVQEVKAGYSVHCRQKTDPLM